MAHHSSTSSSSSRSSAGIGGRGNRQKSRVSQPHSTSSSRAPSADAHRRRGLLPRLGLSPLTARLVLCVLLFLPCSLGLRILTSPSSPLSSSPFSCHLFCAISGLSIYLLAYGPLQTLETLMLPTLVAYLLLRNLPRSFCGHAVLLVSFLFLSLRHWADLHGWPQVLLLCRFVLGGRGSVSGGEGEREEAGRWLQASGALMVLALRLSSVALDYQDGADAFDDVSNGVSNDISNDVRRGVTSGEKNHADSSNGTSNAMSRSESRRENPHRIEEPPSLAEFLGFVFFCGTLMAGPVFEFKAYRQFARRQGLWLPPTFSSSRQDSSIANGSNSSGSSGSSSSGSVSGNSSSRSTRRRIRSSRECGREKSSSSVLVQEHGGAAHESCGVGTGEDKHGRNTSQTWAAIGLPNASLAAVPEQQQPHSRPDPTWPALAAILQAVVCGVAHLWLAPRFRNSALRRRSFFRQGLLSRLAAVTGSALSFRCFSYLLWSITEAGMIVCELGFTGLRPAASVAADAPPASTPTGAASFTEPVAPAETTAAPARAAAATPVAAAAPPPAVVATEANAAISVATWDRARNADPWQVEFACSSAQYPLYFNRGVGLWLRTYIYDRLEAWLSEDRGNLSRLKIHLQGKEGALGSKQEAGTGGQGKTARGRARQGSSFVALFVTQLVSALWHGFYPGHYLFFLTSALVQHASKMLFRLQKRMSQGKLRAGKPPPPLSFHTPGEGPSGQEGESAGCSGGGGSFNAECAAPEGPGKGANMGGECATGDKSLQSGSATTREGSIERRTRFRSSSTCEEVQGKTCDQSEEKIAVNHIQSSLGTEQPLERNCVRHQQRSTGFPLTATQGSLAKRPKGFHSDRWRSYMGHVIQALQRTCLRIDWSAWLWWAGQVVFKHLMIDLCVIALVLSDWRAILAVWRSFGFSCVVAPLAVCATLSFADMIMPRPQSASQKVKRE